MNKVILSCAAWNSPYIDNYLNYIYPNHLECLKQIKDIEYEYLLYTSVKDLPKIQDLLHLDIVNYYSNKVIVTSTKQQYVRLVFIDEHLKYDIEYMQMSTLQHARDTSASIFILAADVIYPKYSFSNILKLADSTDKKVYFAPAYRVNSDIIPHLKNCNYSARNLVKLSLDNMHSKMLRHCVDNDVYDNKLVTTVGYVPSLFWWKFNNTGFLMRTFHMTPMFFKKAPPLGPKESIDQGFYLSKVYSDSDFYIVEDSDVAINIDIDISPSLPLPPIGTILDLPNRHNISLDPYGNQIDPKPGCNLTKPELREWAKVWTHRSMRTEMKYNICIHSEDLTEEWNVLKTKVGKFILETYDTLLDS